MLRQRMVEEQIKRRGVRDSRVLKAMLKVPRHLFVPESHLPYAYDDSPLPIGHGQTISQPYIVAYMTEVLKLKGNERVLEIGTGSGYQTAILAELVREVYTVELIPDLLIRAMETLNSLGYTNIFYRIGDGHEGWPEQAPFDACLVTAAPEKIPEKLPAQLKPGGRMIIPVGSWFQELILIEKHENRFVKKTLLPVRFVPLIRRED